MKKFTTLLTMAFIALMSISFTSCDDDSDIAYTLDDVTKVQEHNEREKDSYSNQDIDTTQTHRNVHFKKPTDSYAAMFDQMIADGVISTRGLKADAVKYGELLFDFLISTIKTV